MCYFVILLVFEGVMLIFSVRRGRSFVDKAEETLAIVQENGEAANGIAKNLNDAISSCKNGFEDLVTQANSVSEASEQMGKVVESTTNATITFSEKINSANEEVNKSIISVCYKDGIIELFKLSDAYSHIGMNEIENLSKIISY